MSRHYHPDSPVREARVEPIESRRALVREALATFGEGSARRLAKSLNVPFETCRAEIRRAERTGPST